MMLGALTVGNWQLSRWLRVHRKDNVEGLPDTLFLGGLSTKMMMYG